MRHLFGANSLVPEHSTQNVGHSWALPVQDQPDNFFYLNLTFDPVHAATISWIVHGVTITMKPSDIAAIVRETDPLNNFSCAIDSYILRTHDLKMKKMARDQENLFRTALWPELIFRPENENGSDRSWESDRFLLLDG